MPHKIHWGAILGSLCQQFAIKAGLFEYWCKN